MNPTGIIGRLSEEIMIAIACVMMGVLTYGMLTESGRRLMERLDDWMTNFIRRMFKGEKEE